MTYVHRTSGGFSGKSMSISSVDHDLARMIPVAKVDFTPKLDTLHVAIPIGS